MTGYEMRVRVTEVGELQTFQSGFSKRTMKADTLDKFPQPLEFEFLKDRADLLDRVREGQMAMVSFDIRGRIYNGRTYISLAAWKIETEAETVPDDGIVPVPALDDETPPF